MMNRLLTLAAVVGISLAGAACQSTDFASDDNNYDNRSADRSTLNDARMNGNVSDKTPSAQSAMEGPLNNSSTNGQLNNQPSPSANVNMDTTHTAHPSANNTGNISNGTTNMPAPGSSSPSANENR